LAVPDLIFSLYYIVWFGSIANQKIHPDIYQFEVLGGKSVGYSITSAYIIANVYLNAAVSYEVFLLLQNSRQVRRSDPPSIMKVSLQAAAVFCFSIIFFVIDYSFRSAATKAYDDEDYERFNNLSAIIWGIWSHVFGLLAMLPIGFLGYVCIMIWCRGYMPSMNGITARDKAMRELTSYFFRIVAVFVWCWLPTIIISDIEVPCSIACHWVFNFFAIVL